ncbi:hypothetical protein EH243_08900 [Amphritea opalescens]|uniref:Electron transfer flavoprotein alpha/beta-subunit N-terminal domain-containing protein n=1 Tax=Amphritea opalescens TaxID=2490544 RepID=A0A430KRU5_9GAMM|nr:hypothetical protein [Amphritea opalescens]RTE66225.1 hypothetical protein EH243_08900 [Amphritea opalescens]
MKIVVILTPDTSGGVACRLLSQQAQDSIREALKLQRSGQAASIKIVVMGQPLQDSERLGLQQEGVVYRYVQTGERKPDAMELAELCVDIIGADRPDLMFVAHGDAESQSPLAHLLAELLEFRQADHELSNDGDNRTLVIREIGSGMQAVCLSALPSANNTSAYSCY